MTAWCSTNCTGAQSEPSVHVIITHTALEYFSSTLVLHLLNFWFSRPVLINSTKCPTLKPGLHDNFFGTVPVWIWPRCLKFAARHPRFLSCKWINSWHECPKTYGAETMWIGSLGPRMSWGTRATNFAIYTTKMERAGLQILGTGAKFKRVPC